MVDPVVNSKYGNRPLLEVPALVVKNGPAHMEVNSLQDRHPQMIPYPESLSGASLQLQGQQGQSVPTLMPTGALPMALPGSMFYAPPQGNVAPAMNAQFVNVPSMNLQAPPYTVVDPTGKPVPAPAQFPVSNPAFPVAPPQGYYPTSYQPPAIAPPPVDNFVVEGQLQYGCLTTLHFRDGNASNFRGLPEYLRMELLNTYGAFPITEIRVVAQGGSYHIYATPRRPGEREEDDFLYGALDRGRPYTATTYGGGAPNQRRLIGGFNRIVGHTAPDVHNS